MWVGVPYDERIYIKFDIPSNNVTSATLHLYDYYGRIPDDEDISYERVLGAWDATLTYNTQPDLSETYTQVPTVSGQWVELDVTDVVNAWVDGAENYGVRIHGQPTSQATAIANIGHSNPDLHPYLTAEEGGGVNLSFDPNVPQDNDLISATAAGIRGNFALLEDSQVVDHNLGEADPALGYYVRLECGLQVCWRRPLKDETWNVAAGANQVIEYDFPIAFEQNPFVSVSGRPATTGGAIRNGVLTIEGNTTTMWEVRVSNFDSGGIDEVRRQSMLAIGRWK